MESRPAVARTPRVLSWSDHVKTLLLPPAGLFLVAFVGLALWLGGWKDAGVVGVGVAVGTLYLLALPGVGAALLGRLDRYSALDPEDLDMSSPTVIVVLDGGRRVGAREYGGDGLKALTLERLAYAAWLWKRLRCPPRGIKGGRHCPVLVTGNGAGELMASYLDELFGVPVEWIEPASRNTWESARESAAILRREGVGRVVLVTHFWHMPRAVRAFASMEFEVVPGPLDFQSERDGWERGLLALVPSVMALQRSRLALHEGVGMVWYRWRYGRVGPAGSRPP